MAFTCQVHELCDFQQALSEQLLSWSDESFQVRFLNMKHLKVFQVRVKYFRFVTKKFAQVKFPLGNHFILLFMETSKIAASVLLQGKSECCAFPQGRHSEFQPPLSWGLTLGPLNISSSHGMKRVICEGATAVLLYDIQMFSNVFACELKFHIVVLV